MALVQPIKAGFFRGMLLKEYYQPSILDVLARIDELSRAPEAQVLLESRNRVVVVKLPLSPGEEKEVVVKEFRPQGLTRIRESLFASRAKRAFYRALDLKERNLATPEPIGFLEHKKRGKKGYYLSLKVSEGTEVRHLFRHLSSSGLESLLHDLARFIRRAHDQGVLHRDLSDGNILARFSHLQGWHFCFLDTNRVKIKNKIGLWKGIKNLIRLGIPSVHQKYFLRSYLEKPNLPLTYWCWYRWLKLTFSGWIKIKKALRLKTLARFFKIQ